MKFTISLPDGIIRELEKEYQLELARINERQLQIFNDTSPDAYPCILLKPTFEVFLQNKIIDLLRERRD